MIRGGGVGARAPPEHHQRRISESRKGSPVNGNCLVCCLCVCQRLIDHGFPNHGLENGIINRLINGIKRLITRIIRLIKGWAPGGGGAAALHGALAGPSAMN